MPGSATRRRCACATSSASRTASAPLQSRIPRWAKTYRRAGTEIEFLNGFVVREGEKIGLPRTANAVLTDLVKRVERNELSPDPRHITELRLN
ncbi:ketopantoate reductase C-terminal domain-containing protein [Bradyrhizobium sp. 31Argb]|uniref:ketopantoate reductase C-terminal domain-containing protein n=1 Tax=Bradyrhizobium sp. 31Argb TaxID=3141247 RepID=UPI003749BF5F